MMKKFGVLFLGICLSLSVMAMEESTTTADMDVTAKTTVTDKPAATTKVVAEAAPVEKVVEKADSSESKVLTLAKPENQIPLTIDQVKKTADSEPMSARVLMTGVILAAFLGTAYYFVKKYKVSNSINKSNRQIKILSQHYLGPKKSLAIVRVAGESILIGVTDQNISMIKSLSILDDELAGEAPQNFEQAMSAEDIRGVQELDTTTTAATKTKISSAATKAAAQAMQTNQAAQTTRVQQQQMAQAQAGRQTGVVGTMNDDLEEEFSFSGLRDSVSKKLKSMRSI